MPHPFADLGATIVSALGGTAAISVTRMAAGAYVDGVWTPGAPTVTAFDAVVQPSTPREVSLLPENQRSKEAITIYTVDSLQTATPAGVEADLVAWSGRNWRVLVVEDWTVQAQYARAVAVREGL